MPLAALMTMMAIVSAVLLLSYDFSKFRFVSRSPQNADSGVNGVHLVDGWEVTSLIVCRDARGDGRRARCR